MEFLQTKLSQSQTFSLQEIEKLSNQMEMLSWSGFVLWKMKGVSGRQKKTDRFSSWMNTSDTPTFKIKVVRLVSYKGQVKHLFLLFKWLILPYFFGCNCRYILLLGPCLSMTLTGRAIKLN